MSIIDGLISAKLCQALGWTLVHSLWQGAVIVLGLILLLTFSRSNSRVRYRLGLIALLLITLFAVVTFGSFFVSATPSFQPNQKGQTVFSLEPISGVGTNLLQAVPGKIFPAGIVSFCRNYINSHLTWIISLWLLGIMLLSLRQAGGLLYLQRLKKSRSSVMPANWQRRLTGLAQRMGLKKTVKLLESAQIKTPMTFGYLKPVILLPAGLVTGLPLEQVEALLAHELAHIFRNDFLINSLQNGLETIFFFNPGVRWLSSLVHNEREHCSDDLAVSICGDALNYARALASLQETSTRNLEPALAAAGNSHKLFQRIKRLLKLPQQRPEFTGKSLAAIFLGICVLILAVGAVVASPPGTNPASQNISGSPELKNSASGQSQTGKQQAKQAFTVFIFDLPEDDKVELTGEIQEQSGNPVDCWLIDAKTDQVAWKLAPGKLQVKKAGCSFQDEVILNRGKYRLYYPSECKITILTRTISLKRVGNENSAAPLKSKTESLLEPQNEQYKRKMEFERLMTEEKKQAEEEKKAEMEQLKKLLEEERQTYIETKRQAEKKYKMELEMSKLAEEQQRKESVEKNEKAIQAEELINQMEKERALQEDEKRKLEEVERLKKEKEAQEQLEQEIEKKKAEADNTKEGDLVSLAEVKVKPKKISGNWDPPYSDSLRKNHKGKTITFSALILIDENGDVTKVKILPDNVPSDIKRVIEDALYQWKYSPAMKDNFKVKVWLTVLGKISL